jgi:hypothetical protein
MTTSNSLTGRPSAAAWSRAANSAASGCSGIRERGGDEARVADAQRKLDARRASQAPGTGVAVTGNRPPAARDDQPLHLIAVDVRGEREPLRQQAGCRRLASARVTADDPDLGALAWLTGLFGSQSAKPGEAERNVCRHPLTLRLGKPWLWAAAPAGERRPTGRDGVAGR